MDVKRQTQARMEVRSGTGLRARAWAFIRAHRDGVTVSQVATAAKASRSAVRHFLDVLVLGEFLQVETRQIPTGKVAIYTLVRDNGIEAPRLDASGKPVTTGLGREQMWRTLRMLRQALTFHELAAHASTDTVPVASTTAREYLQGLEKAGYLEVVEAAIPGATGRAARYRLKPGKNTGPRPPMLLARPSVYDPNLRKVVWAAEVSDDDL